MQFICSPFLGAAIDSERIFSRCFDENFCKKIWRAKGFNLWGFGRDFELFGFCLGTHWRMDDDSLGFFVPILGGLSDSSISD